LENPEQNINSRFKVLISAYACEPGKGSEPYVGWNWIQQMSRFHEIWVLTRSNNRKNIEAYLEKNPMPNVHWHYVHLPRWLTFWKKGNRGIYLYYYMWQIKAYWMAKALHQQHNFDLVHHVTFVNYWMPSFVSRLDTPYVWGPVGGGEASPSSFYSTLSQRGHIMEYLRDTIQRIARLDPFVRSTARQADKILVTTEQTGDCVKGIGGKNVEVLSQVALTQDEYDTLTALPRHQEDTIRFISIGRIIGWKGFHLGLSAFAKFHESYPDSEYWIIGEGRDKARLEQLAKEHGIEDCVTFWGNISRESVMQKFVDCDVLIHPSLHDSGAIVCAEAMSAGLPVLCLDVGGPSVQVVPETGFKIKATNPTQAINDLSQAMHTLAQNPQHRLEMGQAAKKRVKENFLWSVRADQMNEIYQSLVPKKA